MGVFDQFPYSNIHELNMDWVLESVKSAMAQLKEFEKKFDYLYKLYPELSAQIYQIKIDLRNTEARLKNAIDDLNRKVDSFDFATHVELAQTAQQIYRSIESNVLTLKSDIKLLYTYVDRGDTLSKYYTDQEIAWLYNEFYNLSLNPVQEVISPVTGKKGSVQQALDDLYDWQWKFFAELWGITAKEYDDLLLTASQFQSFQITAVQYDYIARFYLKPWREVYSGHSMTLSAEEYDGDNITAENFTTANLMAWQYDQRGLWYFGPYPFETVAGVGIGSKYLLYS